MRLTTLAVLLLALISATLQPFAFAAVAPARPDIPPATAGQDEPGAGLAGPACVVAGTVYCSEYGSRYREPLRLVLTDAGGRHESAISDTNGSFAVPVPCSGSFELRVEFKDKGISVGSFEIPESAEGTVYTLELRHSGSYLELVRDIREGIEGDDITYRLVGPGE